MLSRCGKEPKESCYENGGCEGCSEAKRKYQVVGGDIAVILYATDAKEAVLTLMQLTSYPRRNFFLANTERGPVSHIIYEDPALKIKRAFKVYPLCPLCGKVIRDDKEAVFYEFGTVNGEDGWLHTSCVDRAIAEGKEEDVDEEAEGDAILASMGMDRYGSIPEGN
jgi:hypothetical protein